MAIAFAFLIAGCGKVENSAAIDAASDNVDAAQADGGSATPGTFLWQQPLFTSFAGVDVDSQDQAVVTASFTASFDLGGGALSSNGGSSDLLMARFDSGGTHKASVGYGGSGEEYRMDSALDSNDEVTAVGIFQQTANLGGDDFGPADGFYSFVARYRDNGTYDWSTEMSGGAGWTFAGGGSTSGSAYAAVAGYFDQTFSVGQTSIGTAGGRDVFYVRLNAQGGVADAVSFGQTDNEMGAFAAFDGLGGVYLAGGFDGDFQIGDDLLSSDGGRDIFVARINPRGAPMWAIKLGGAGEDGGGGDQVFVHGAVDSSGNLVLAATFEQSITLPGDKTHESAGSSDVLLTKIDPSGAVLWSERFGGPGDDAPRDVTVGPDDQIGLCGEFSGSVSFGGETHDSEGFLDVFLAEYSADGAFRWSRAGGSGADDRGLGVAFDSQGDLYLTASFHNTIDLGGDPVTANVDDWNGILVKYGTR